MPHMEKENWTIEDSLHSYQINRWGEGYFGINKAGNLCVYPYKSSSTDTICIKSVIEEAKKEGFSFPAVVRFHDVLRGQVGHLNDTFNEVIREANYSGEYMGVYPIKVNQLREVVEEITEAGMNYSYGLEAGSKPELLIALAYNNNPKALTILNGYKDIDYIRLAMLGTEMGRKIVIVIEKISEAYTVLSLAEEYNVEPIIGVRAKLSSRSSGKWSDSSGDFAKFGLSVTEIIDLVELLKEKNKLHLLQLFHFHVGSQIPDIRTIKECLTEGSQIYVNLMKMGVPLKYFDVGGGVGVNYDGQKSKSGSSTNYNLKDYIGDVIYILKDICDGQNIAHPNIISETGRAVTAHHSCVITNVFGTINLTKAKITPEQKLEEEHILVTKTKELLGYLNQTNYQDIYNDACVLKEESISAFKLGVISLLERSIIESTYWNICHRVIQIAKDEKYAPHEIEQLKTTLADKYLCNFSVFQSTPDVWAFDQILPVVPISRLNEKPDHECTLADITCDSDGKINHFLDTYGRQRETLNIHALNEEEYYIGMFLTGAYQDVMGDMHNLFGRLNEIHVYSDSTDPDGFYIEEFIHGNTSADVLKIMQYNPEEMFRKVKSTIDLRIREGKIPARTGVKLTDFYEACLHDYTYLGPVSR